MANRNHVLTTGEYYHIYSRGNSKQNIFLDEQDYLVFQQFLYLMNMESRITLREVGESPYRYERSAQLVSVGTYSLMPNHVHIVVKQIMDGGVSKFLQKVFTGYSMYFNKKYNRTGGLFEGTFKSKHVTDDVYLKYLYTYIHLNPLKIVDSNWKEKIKQGSNFDFSYALKYKFSSVLDYVGEEREENKILTRGDFPDYFVTPNDFTHDLLSYFGTKYGIR